MQSDFGLRISEISTVLRMLFVYVLHVTDGFISGAKMKKMLESVN